MNPTTYDIVTVGPGDWEAQSWPRRWPSRGHGSLSWRRRVDSETGCGENQ
jgi:hypothetical protein